MRSHLKERAWFAAMLLLTSLVTGCSQNLGPQPPAFSGGIWYRAIVVDSQGRQLGAQLVILNIHLTQVLGIGNGTITSIYQQTDQSGTVNTPNAETNATWAGNTSWLYSSFASCLGETINITVPVAGATITEPCTI